MRTPSLHFQEAVNRYGVTHEYVGELVSRFGLLGV